MFNEISINILFVLCACANVAVIVKRTASLSVPWCGDEALTMCHFKEARNVCAGSNQQNADNFKNSLSQNLM